MELFPISESIRKGLYGDISSILGRTNRVSGDVGYDIDQDKMSALDAWMPSLLACLDGSYTLILDEPSSNIRASLRATETSFGMKDEWLSGYRSVCKRGSMYHLVAAGTPIQVQLGSAFQVFGYLLASGGFGIHVGFDDDPDAFKGRPPVGYHCDIPAVIIFDDPTLSSITGRVVEYDSDEFSVFVVEDLAFAE